MSHDISQRPNRIPWPPILVISAIVSAWVLESVWPASSLFAGWMPWLRIAGVLIALAGIGLDLAAMIAMRRARTNVMPNRGAQHLVSTGIFAVSRNPIYLGNTLLLAGIALAWPSPWLLVTALIAAVLVDRLAIRREERHLSARFGAAFAEYMQRVPRWIGWRRR